jgi:phosphoglycolate phosphatase-like HAD superfamily hydrolase
VPNEFRGGVVFDVDGTLLLATSAKTDEVDLMLDALDASPIGQLRARLAPR